MATEEKIKARIRAIAERPNNVVLADIEWVMRQLEQFEDVDFVENEHQRLYCFEGRRFGICTHHKGRKQIKAIYVKQFLNVMIETGWYE